MWEPDDITRSIRRYLAMTLPTGEEDDPRWKLRVERREVKDEERPVGVVLDGPITSVRARLGLVQGNVEEMLPVTISLYPPVAEASIDSLRTARHEASQLKAQLLQLLNTGLTVTTGTGAARRHWAGPFRVPLWDYADVPLTGAEKKGPADPHDVLWIEEKSVSVNAIQDPDDARRWAVIANFRVSIERPGRVPAEDEKADVSGVEGGFGGEPG